MIVLDRKCKICRSVGYKLYLKSTRCFSDKCSIVSHNTLPGRSAEYVNRKHSLFKKQIEERRKVRALYGITTLELKNYFNKSGGNSEDLSQILERRLDNVLYRSGMALSRRHARQLIVHGKVLVNTNKIDIPSYVTSVGECISINSPCSGDACIWLQKISEKEVKIIDTPRPCDKVQLYDARILVEFLSR